ncbi:MAG: cold shock domain-containing protein, partial [Nitrospirae bacterium]|nr:cold shock domain-containing protein [Nitrospirota bacterium]
AVHGMTFEDLEDGTEVAFNAEPGDKGLQATTVNPIPVIP